MNPAQSGTKPIRADLPEKPMPPGHAAWEQAAPRRLLKVGAGLAALMLLLPVTAHPHGAVPFGDPGVIHACRNFYGALRQVTAGNCFFGEAAVHWNSVPTHAIGDLYGGGIVFYVYDGGQHGLIAALADQSAGITWRNTTNNINTFARGNGIGAGEKNTAIIIATQASDGANDFAARVAAEYSVLEDGLTACEDNPPIPAETCIADWYLPSKNELNLLFLQQDVVGGFASTFYWSSTEDDSNNAWNQLFGNGVQFISLKNVTLRVRAVRAF